MSDDRVIFTGPDPGTLNDRIREAIAWGGPVRAQANRVEKVVREFFSVTGEVASAGPEVAPVSSGPAKPTELPRHCFREAPHSAHRWFSDDGDGSRYCPGVPELTPAERVAEHTGSGPCGAQ